jgi:hypothetical protein
MHPFFYLSFNIINTEVNIMNKLIISLCLVLFFQTLTANEKTVKTPNEITMGFLQPPGHPVMEWLTLLYTDAFNRINIKMNRKYYPAKRLSRMSNSGVIDGELGRSYSYNSTPKNLVRIPIAHWEAEFVAYTTNKDLKLKSWKDFKHKDLRVECINGIKLCEKKLPHYTNPKNISIITKPIQGLRKLLIGRTDVFIFTKLGVEKILESNEFKNSGIYFAGTLHKEAAYAYVHKEHEYLVPSLTKVLKNMKEEGLFIKYKNMGMEISEKTIN